METNSIIFILLIGIIFWVFWRFHSLNNSKNQDKQHLTLKQPLSNTIRSQQTQNNNFYSYLTINDDTRQVILHNDDKTPMEYVIQILQTVFSCSPQESVNITIEAHSLNQAIVALLPLLDAQERIKHVEQENSKSGQTLKFTIEVVTAEIES